MTIMLTNKIERLLFLKNKGNLYSVLPLKRFYLGVGPVKGAVIAIRSIQTSLECEANYDQLNHNDLKRTALTHDAFLH